MNTKLVVRPMPELPLSLHKPGDHLYGNVNRLREWGEECAAIAQREAALADELAEALDQFCNAIGYEQVGDALLVASAAIAKHKEARNG